MKLSLFQLPSWKNSPYNTKQVILILVILTFVLLAIIPFWVHQISPFLFRSLEIDINVSMPVYQENKLALPLPSPEKNTNGSMDIRLGKKCNMVKGNWVPYPPGGPYYTNETKCVIDSRQNCFKYGRPDTEFLKWRWKPDECELPLFDAAQFLELVRGKSMAFVGDSVARNQMQSLVCLLTNVTRPLDISCMMEESEHWFYSDYNFTIAHLWSTHLVQASLGVNPYNEVPSNLTLDKPDFFWAVEIETFDFVIISSGHWFLRPLKFYEKGKLVGCHICGKERPTELNVFYAYRTAFRTAFRTLLTLPKFRGVTFLRTITGSHVDHGGNWSEKGDCDWTRPFTRREVKADGVISEMYSSQVEEFREAEREGRRRGLKFRLLDITDPMGLRPDGHPNRYGHWPHEKVRRPDCLHWCLPGPIDVWNEMLLQMIKMETGRSVY